MGDLAAHLRDKNDGLMRVLRETEAQASAACAKIDRLEAEIYTYKLIAEMLGEGDYDFFYAGNNWDNEEHWPLCINVNDTFYPAADSERIPWEEIPEVYQLWREAVKKASRHLILEDRDKHTHQQIVDGQVACHREIHTALVLWVARKRGIEPIDWKGREIK